MAGCATTSPQQSEVTLRSDPPGATIWAGDRNLGIAPVAQPTPVPPVAARVEQYTAKWASGAAATIAVRLEPGKSEAYTIHRPKVAGLEADLKRAQDIQTEQGERERSAQSQMERKPLYCRQVRDGKGGVTLDCG
jgi:hypothetical protein